MNLVALVMFAAGFAACMVWVHARREVRPPPEAIALLRGELIRLLRYVGKQMSSEERDAVIKNAHLVIAQAEGKLK